MNIDVNRFLTATKERNEQHQARKSHREKTILPVEKRKGKRGDRDQNLRKRANSGVCKPAEKPATLIKKPEERQLQGKNTGDRMSEGETKPELKYNRIDD